MSNLSASSAPNASAASRRAMLFGASAAAAGVAAVALVPGAAKPLQASTVPQPDAPENGGGYRVTDHVKRYYATTLV